MSHDCRIVGTIYVKEGTTEDQVRRALTSFLKEHGKSYKRQEDEDGISFEDGQLFLSLEFYGHGGYTNDSVDRLVKDLASIVDGHGYVEMFDDDTGDSEAFCRPYFIGANDFEKQMAQMEYGIEQMEGYIKPLVGAAQFDDIKGRIVEMVKQHVAASQG